MRIALQAPEAFGASADISTILSVCHSLGVEAVEFEAGFLEALLRKPTVPAWWIEAPENAFETGALPLEEEILQDELDLARQTIEARVREWRGQVPLAPIDALRGSCSDAGIVVTSVAWTDLSRLSDPEVDFALRLTRALGAAALVTPLVAGEPRRLARFADRHDTAIGFRASGATSTAELSGAIAHSPRHRLALDLRNPLSPGDGRGLELVYRYSERVSQIYLDAGAIASGNAAVAALLQELRTNPWPIQVALGIDADAAPANGQATLSAAIDYCLNGLRLNT